MLSPNPTWTLRHQRASPAPLAFATLVTSVQPTCLIGFITSTIICCHHGSEWTTNSRLGNLGSPAVETTTLRATSTSLVTPFSFQSWKRCAWAGVGPSFCDEASFDSLRLSLDRFSPLRIHIVPIINSLETRSRPRWSPSTPSSRQHTQAIVLVWAAIGMMPAYSTTTSWQRFADLGPFCTVVTTLASTSRSWERVSTLRLVQFYTIILRGAAA